MALDDEALASTVTTELGKILGGDLSSPTHRQIIRWPNGIPQYTMGHGERVASIRDAIRPHSGLVVAGNGVVGVSVADCVGFADTLPDLIR